MLNVGVLKVTSGNATKRLGTRQETRVVTRAGKNGATAIQQMATQEPHGEKLVENRLTGIYIQAIEN